MNSKDSHVITPTFNILFTLWVIFSYATTNCAFDWTCDIGRSSLRAVLALVNSVYLTWSSRASPRLNQILELSKIQSNSFSVIKFDQNLEIWDEWNNDQFLAKWITQCLALCLPYVLPMRNRKMVARYDVWFSAEPAKQTSDTLRRDSWLALLLLFSFTRRSYVSILSPSSSSSPTNSYLVHRSSI